MVSFAAAYASRTTVAVSSDPCTTMGTVSSHTAEAVADTNINRQQSDRVMNGGLSDVCAVCASNRAREKNRAYQWTRLSVAAVTACVLVIGMQIRNKQGSFVRHRVRRA